MIIRTIPALASLTEDVIGYARANNLALVFVILVVNGIAEELFFRGALFAAIGVRHPVLISTIIYALATVAGGNPVLVFAAAVLGAVVGLQRRAGGGVLAPILTHITWSSAMLFALPPTRSAAASAPSAYDTRFDATGLPVKRKPCYIGSDVTGGTDD